MFMNYRHHVSIPSLFPNTCFNANAFENLIIRFMGEAHSLDYLGNAYTSTSKKSYLGIKLGICIGGGRND